MSAKPTYKRFVDLDEVKTVTERDRKYPRQLAKAVARHKTAQIQKMWHGVQATCAYFEHGKCAVGHPVCRPCEEYRER
jgi:hypothetical protein